jgi:ABC-type multidrug transport system fused ATPase/permease subunit
MASLQALAANFWLKAWVETNARNDRNLDRAYWLVGFFLIGSSAGIVSMGRKITGRIFCGLRASRVLHDKMASAVLRSPMVFFETTPIGRIINRFSSDVNELDEGLPVAFIDLLRTVVKLFVSFGVVIYAAPVILGVMIPLSVLYYYYQTFYQGSSRELKRLLSISRSPIFSHFQESLNGISTIRAYGREERFKSDHIANLDGNIRAIYLFRSANRWLTFRLQTIGALIVFATAVTIVMGSAAQVFTPGLIGVMMTYIVQMTDFFSWIVKAYVNLETSVVGVERVLEYCDLPAEAPPVVKSNRPPKEWPAQGRITYKNYSTKYRANLDLVLREVNIDIVPREKIGIVGRTGAGKSSLILSLFRIIEATSGSIEIDGIDISQIGLRDLRSSLSIIPQDSQVFEGTIRQNLDPLGVHTDDRLWRVLEMSHLKEHVLAMDGGLDATLAEGGTNLSAGQRQLMCLGRALLHKSSILVLDEATASVDVQTDKLVQETIRSAFKDHTIVTIAHRLNTILDSDRVLVLDRGKVAEFDTPHNLLQNPDSLFFSLCKQGGHLEEGYSSSSS